MMIVIGITPTAVAAVQESSDHPGELTVIIDQDSTVLSLNLPNEVAALISQAYGDLQTAQAEADGHFG